MGTADIDRATQRKRDQGMKPKVRRAMLQTMPKGGTAIEIGVWKGDFTRMLLNQLQPDKLILIDPWISFDDRDAAFDGQTAADEFEGIYQDVCRTYAPELASGQIEIMRELSAAALAKIPHNSLSFAYLDGDHSYDGVVADLAAVYPCMKVGGIIMMDDYHRRGWWGDAVVRAANEFIGTHAKDVRIWSMRGAQLALEKLA